MTPTDTKDPYAKILAQDHYTKPKIPTQSYQCIVLLMPRLYPDLVLKTDRQWLFCGLFSLFWLLPDKAEPN